MKITVIGIGQTVRGDDGAGIAAVRKWQESFPHTATRPDVSVHFSELPGLDLLDLLEGFDAAVLVDALDGGGVPGTIHRLGPDEIAAFASGARSAHGWGVGETLALAQHVNSGLGRIPIRLVGITAEQMQLGAVLSRAVQQSLPAAAEAIDAEVQRFLAAS
ncbi:MAG TPA: hydrogenase maturation protease [Anaerolineales bacterium]